MTPSPEACPKTTAANIGKLLSECNVKRGGNKNKPWINFDEGFDLDKFKGMVATYVETGKKERETE